MLWLGIENKTHLIRFRKMTRLTVLVLVATDMATGAPTTCQKYLLFFFVATKHIWKLSQGLININN